MNVGLFGGSFDPPHLAHLILAETLAEQLALDRVLWMPGNHPPHKLDEVLAPAADRLAMVRLAVAGNPRFEASDLEIRRGGTSYTVDTLRALRAARPEDTLVLLIGGDSLRDFFGWRDPEEILSLATLGVYRRAGVEPAAEDPRLAGRVRYADAPLLEISSTAIRRRLLDGRSVRYLVPDAVRAYLQERRLYSDA